MFWTDLIARYLVELTVRLVGVEKAQAKVTSVGVARANAEAAAIEKARFGK